MVNQRPVIFGWQGHMNRMVLVAVLVGATIGWVRPIEAGIFGNAFGGAMQGGLLGSLLDGRDGAQTGAAIGAGVGLLTGIAENEKRRDAEKAAQERYEQRKWAMEEQQRAADAARWETEKYQMEDGVPSNLASIGGLQPHEDAKLITEIQRSLVKLGYDPGNADGRLSEQTITGILVYQSRAGLLETGQPSQELLKHMVRNGG